MEHSLRLVVTALSIVACIKAEPPVGDSVAIVSDVDSNPSTAYAAPSSYSNYQSNAPQAQSYTSAVAARTGYQTPRSAYGTAYLPVIPVSAYFSSPSSADYGAYSQRGAPVYGAGTPWAGASRSWQAGTYNPWAASTASPWSGPASSFVGSQQPWAGSAIWPGSNPWADSGAWASSASPWAGSSQPWNSATRYQK